MVMAVAVHLHRVEGASPEQGRFIELAIDRLREALADGAFLDAVASADYVETRWMTREGESRSYSASEIAGRIAQGIERGSDADSTLDFALALADMPGPESGKHVLGSTALGCQPIHPAKWFIERCRMGGDAVNLASHLMHEWMHLSGFYHWPDNKARGDAPYVVGRLVREALAPKYAFEIEPAITALMHDVETDCGCRGNPKTR